mgnify:CR=1 FL=1
MNRTTLAALLALASTAAFAQGPQECAAFMDMKGLAIADEAAGAHGEQGRNRALAASVTPTITSAAWIPAAGAVPDFCRVFATITTGDAQTGFGRVRFVVNLPSPWNGRFVMLGDGGFDGGVSTSTARLDQGYATANSDMGHSSQEFPGATFGFDARQTRTLTAKQAGLTKAKLGKLDLAWAIGFLLLMIAVPAIGAAVVAGLPKGRDELARQIALALSGVVLLLAVPVAVAGPWLLGLFGHQLFRRPGPEELEGFEPELEDPRFQEEQRRISIEFEVKPEPTEMAIQEMFNREIYFRDPAAENEE